MVLMTFISELIAGPAASFVASASLEWQTARIAFGFHQPFLPNHTGTVDPMAEGVIIVLLGEERHKKYEYAEWIKEYVFEVIFGASTDTYDGLGLLTSFHDGFVDEGSVEKALESFKGDYVQDVPPYSSAKVNGKPLHWFARNAQLSGVEIPRRAGHVYEIELLDFYTKDFKHVVREIVEKINLVTGDLRQEKIKTRWAQLVETVEMGKTVQIAKIRVKMSKGLYVRSLSQDIAEKLKTSGFVFSLVRTQNGDYTRENSKTLEEVFGTDFPLNYDFNSHTVQEED